MDDQTFLTEKIIGCAIEVHRHLGPGLLEATYEEALCVEFDLQGLGYVRQLTIPVRYKGRPVARYRLDLLVQDLVVIEVKSAESIAPVFQAQLLAYLRASGKRVGLLMNFNSPVLKDGIRRMVL